MNLDHMNRADKDRLDVLAEELNELHASHERYEDLRNKAIVAKETMKIQRYSEIILWHEVQMGKRLHESEAIFEKYTSTTH